MGHWLTRRKFIIAMAGLAVTGVGFFTFDRWLIDKIAGRLRVEVTPPSKLPADSERGLAGLPPEGQRVSVEMALNSRCNSDYGGNQRYMHWGMFNRDKTISVEQVKRVIDSSSVPRFTTERTTISSEGRRLTFLMDSRASGIAREWLMVENGMQQQAIGLVSAALGVGMVFRNLGMDGQLISAADYGTIRMDLDAMKPSYGGSFWTQDAPVERKPWLSGSLPDPSRDGRKPLLQVFKSLDIRHTGTSKADLPELGQLLWAAKGRTPHLYKSKPWGLTIPFWTDRVETSSVYLVWNGRVHKYVNWGSDRPTHSIAELSSPGQEKMTKLGKRFYGKETFIVLGRNDDHGRAFWEVGYELINLLVQARALDVGYEAFLLRDSEKRIFAQAGINNPVAVLSL